MAGRPGRSGGHNKIPISEHLLRGTFNATRHRARLAAELPMPAPTGDPLPADVAAGLGSRGLAFAEATWRTYGGWTPATRVLLHEAARLIDQLEQLRGQRGERDAQRLLLSTLAALNLEA